MIKANQLYLEDLNHIERHFKANKMFNSTERSIQAFNSFMKVVKNNKILIQPEPIELTLNNLRETSFDIYDLSNIHLWMQVSIEEFKESIPTGSYLLYSDFTVEHEEDHLGDPRLRGNTSKSRKLQAMFTLGTRQDN